MYIMPIMKERITRTLFVLAPFITVAFGFGTVYLLR